MTQNRSCTGSETASSNGAAELRCGTPGRASRTAGGGNNGEAGAPPSNTAPANYIQSGSDPKILRYGVDSLYLSYPGSLSTDWAQRLDGLKLAAQSQNDSEEALAQVRIGEHLFEVLGRGRGKYMYVLVDNCFQIALSSTKSKSLPLAYVQISSEYLTALGVIQAESNLRYIINSLGLVSGPPTISRVDLFADFLSDVDMTGWPAGAWVTRAHKVDNHHIRRQFTGWSIGMGGPMGARLYNKTLELEHSKKDYLRPLWKTAGWNEQDPVWRLEFQYKREALKELSVLHISDLLDNLRGLWAYATETWIRLTIPSLSDENRTRWPTHPLWAYLAALDWAMPASPTLARVRKERIPCDESLFVNGLGPITSFMAREGITDLAEGFGEFLARAHRFHDAQGRKEGSTFKKYVTNKVASKGRKYNTLLNENPAEEAAQKARAKAYRKMRDGE